MHKGLLAATILMMISPIVQILSVITVPITGKSVNYNLLLCWYDEVAYGVLGMCRMDIGECTKARVGYQSNASDTSGGKINYTLPSNARHTISKLLVVHILAIGFSAILLILTVILNIIIIVEEIRLKKLKSQLERKFSELKRKNDSREESTQHDSLAASASNRPASITNSEVKDGLSWSSYKRFKVRDSNQILHKVTPLLNLMILHAVLSFLLSLLAFLVDLILFIPYLSFVSWIQLFPIFTFTIILTMMCYVKRLISSRKYLDLRTGNTEDNINLLKENDLEEGDDNISDDGFYVYTNGFYSNYRDGNGSILQSSPRTRWIHHGNDNSAALHSISLELSEYSMEYGTTDDDDHTHSDYD